MVDLFSKRRSDANSPNRRRLKDFDDDEYPADMKGPLSMSGNDRDNYVKPSPLEELIKDTRVAGVGEKGEIMSRFDDMQDELNRLDTDIASLRRESAHIRNRVQKIEEQVVVKLPAGRRPPAPQHEPEQTLERRLPAARDQTPDNPNLELDEELPTFRPFREGEPEHEPEIQPHQPHIQAIHPHSPPHRPIQTESHLPPQVDKVEQTHVYLGVPSTRTPPVKEPILTRISHDYMTLVLVMRWIEFLFERVTRDKISLVLDYYVEVGWISEGVKSQIMSMARGEMQDVTRYMAPEETPEDAFREVPTPAAAPYKKVEDWRLSADDHLKSLLFIQKIAGFEVDKDRLNSLEQSIARFKESLEGFHGI